jgi:DNA-binding transcriptional ArsR family regulator
LAALSTVSAAEFGVGRNANYRALIWLEQAGLMKVERELGRRTLAAILDGEGSHERKS